jgi:hypothetical protein
MHRGIGSGSPRSLVDRLVPNDTIRGGRLPRAAIAGLAALPFDNRHMILKNTMKTDGEDALSPTAPPGCVLQYLCPGWGFCVPNAASNMADPQAPFNWHNAAAGTTAANARRVDIFTRGAGGNADTFMCSSRAHNAAAAPAAMQPHIATPPIYLFKANIAMVSRTIWNHCLEDIAAYGVVMYEGRPYPVGSDPAAGGPDTRRLEWRLFMVAPCKEQDWSTDQQPPLHSSTEWKQWRKSIGGPDPNPPLVTNAANLPSWPGSNDDMRNMRMVNGFVVCLRPDPTGVTGLGNPYPWIMGKACNDYFNPGGAHRAAVEAAGYDRVGRNIEQEAADSVKNTLRRLGGPKCIFLGPSITNELAGRLGHTRANGSIQNTPFRLGNPRWEQRLTGPVQYTTLEWSRLTRLDTLILDFWHLRVEYEWAGAAGGVAAAQGKVQTWIQNTVGHIVGEFARQVDGDGKAKPHAGLGLLVVGGLRTEVIAPDALAGGLMYGCFPPGPPAPQPTAAGIAAAAVGVCPHGRAAPNPNWYKIFRPLLRPGGRLILADIDYLHSLPANTATGDQLPQPYFNDIKMEAV